MTLRVNEAYEHLLEADYPYRFEVTYGGAGSGKSYGVDQAIVVAALRDPGRGILVVRKVAKSIRHSVWELTLATISDMGATRQFDINKSEFRISHRRNGARILFAGLDDVEKLKSVYDISEVWGEEATEFTPNDVRQLDLRMRGGRLRKRMHLTFNPISDGHWLKRDFFDNPRDDTRVTHTTWRDNAFLDDEYRLRLARLKDEDPYFYAVYSEGEWGRLGNLVFSNYVIEDFDYGEDELENVRQGMDFGFNHPSAIARVGFRDDELYIFDELYETRLTNTELIAAAKEFDPDYERNVYRADSAEPDRIEEFNQAGFNVEPAKKGANSVRHGIDYLKRYRVHIHRSRCPNMAREWSGYKWREDRNGEIMHPEQPVDLNNHGIDAVRYATEDLWDGSSVDVWIPGYDGTA